MVTIDFSKCKTKEDVDREYAKWEKKKETPTCSTCGKPMINAYDSIMKKNSPYLWKTTCGHCPDLRLCELSLHKR